LIHFCVPTHDEEKTVGVVLWKLRHVMAELPRDYQILVGDDASSDGTAESLDPYRRVLPLVLMRSKARRGYAATLEMLLRQAVRMSRYPKRDSVVVLQADFTDDLDATADLLRRLESGSDIAIGGPVADAVRPRLFERLAKDWAHKALSRLDWPDNADPLNTLAAYRLICVKRAFEESHDDRLLAWDGAAANAALLRAALPHARRVECVEMTRHADRSQRKRRFRVLEFISTVRRFLADTRPADLVAVDSLTPDEVRGDLSVLHGPAANGAEQRPGRERRAPHDSARPRKPGGGSRGGTDGARSPARRRSASGRPTRAAVQEAPDSGDPPKTTDSGSADGPDRLRRSRGGRRRRGGQDRKPAAGSGTVVSPVEDGTAPDPVPSQRDDAPENGSGKHAGQDRQDTVNEGDADAPKKRRRRGRRGGKRRRRSSPQSGTIAAPEDIGESESPGGGEGSS